MEAIAGVSGGFTGGPAWFQAPTFPTTSFPTAPQSAGSFSELQGQDHMILVLSPQGLCSTALQAQKASVAHNPHSGAAEISIDRDSRPVLLMWEVRG
jgi:hypothetical protein